MPIECTAAISFTSAHIQIAKNLKIVRDFLRSVNWITI